MKNGRVNQGLITNTCLIAGLLLSLWGVSAQSQTEEAPKKRLSTLLFGTEGKGGGISCVGSAGCRFTLGTVELEAHPQPLSAKEIPGLALAIESVKSLPFQRQHRSALLSMLAPSDFREYHRLAEDDLPGLKNETAVIEKEYGAAITKVLKNDGLGITAGVGAITGENEEVGITLLLPDFFRLQKSRTDPQVNEPAQAALLVMEAFRLISVKKVIPSLAKADLERMLLAQMGFESLLNGRRPLISADRIGRLFEDSLFALRLALSADTAGLAKTDLNRASFPALKAALEKEKHFVSFNVKRIFEIREYLARVASDQLAIDLDLEISRAGDLFLNLLGQHYPPRAIRMRYGGWSDQELLFSILSVSSTLNGDGWAADLLHNRRCHWKVTIISDDSKEEKLDFAAGEFEIDLNSGIGKLKETNPDRNMRLSLDPSNRCGSPIQVFEAIKTTGKY